MKAVLLVNMGSPSSESEVKIFLRQMFKDPAIIRLPYIFRNLLSYIISSSRYKKSWGKYELIGGSPLALSDENLTEKLSESLGDDYLVAYACSYVHPFTEEKISSLYNQGIRELQVIPLYPHFSYTTTGSVKNEIAKMSPKYNGLEIKVSERFYNNPSFIELWQSLIKNALQKNDMSSPLLLFSAHSIPVSNTARGDTYVKEIKESSEKIANSLGLDYRIGYQSQMGRVKWEEPSTKSVLKNLSTEGISEVLLVPISFLGENLETMYDLDVDIVPYAQMELNFRSVARVRFQQSHPLLLKTLKSIIAEG